MLIIQHHGTTTPIQYNHVINPIKVEGSYAPNWNEYNRIKSSGAPINILKNDFERVQSEGAIIIINRAGGWCTMTYGMDVLKGAELLDKECIGN